MTKVGIVVPVHNAADFLGETIHNVRDQTLTDWCCVLVDDGSSDRSPVICDEAAEADKRFIVLHQPKSGPSAARNAGWDALPPCDYLCFADADDTMHPK